MTVALPTRAQWLDAVVSDPGISSTAFRAAWTLSRKVNAQGRLQGRMLDLAVAAGISEATCRSVLLRLEERGFIKLRIERGFVTLSICPSLPKRKLRVPLAAE